MKESTYIKYDTALIKHIKPKLGGCFPMGITTGLIDGFTEEQLFEEELAPKTVHDVLVVLHGVLKYTAAFFPGTFPAVEINNQSRVKKRCGYYLVRSRPDSFLTCWRIWILQVRRSAGALYRRPYRRALRAAMGKNFSERADDPH